MKASALLTAVVLLLCGHCLAQDKSSQTANQAKSPIPKAAEAREDWKDEEASREMLILKMRREHSDQHGNPGPDLFVKGIAHFQHMKVASLSDDGKQTAPDTKP